MEKMRQIYRDLKREDLEYEKKQGNDHTYNRHYSQKGGHKERSIANDPHKKSKRR